MFKRSRVFYGWWIVASSCLGLGFGAAPLLVFSFGVFFKPLMNDFHANRAAVSLAFTLHNLASAASAPLIGRLIDRFGARRVILIGTTLFAMILLSSKALGSGIRYLYVFYATLGIVSPMTTTVPYGAIVSRWFDRYRGLALGLMMLGIGVGATVTPLVMYRLVETFGWRNSFAIASCSVVGIALPVLVSLLKDDPREQGLWPDGAIPAESSELRTLQKPKTEEGLSWHEIWHASTFWLLICTFFLAGASVHASTLHMPALLTDRGVSPHDAALAGSIVGIALLLGRVATGYLLDRFFAPRVAMAFFGGAAVGMAVLMTGTAGKIALAAAFLVGLGFGAEGDIIAYTMSRYFGLKAFGTAYGYAFSAFVLAGGLGTLLMGLGFDWTHAYNMPLLGFFLATLLAAALMTRLGPYRYVSAGAAEAPASQRTRVIAEEL